MGFSNGGGTWLTGGSARGGGRGGRTFLCLACYSIWKLAVDLKFAESGK